MTVLRPFAALLALASSMLVGCGEKSQAIGQSSARKADTPAWQGVAAGTHTADGYKAGDKAAWEAQLKTRAERGQNEYTRTSSSSKQ